MTELLSRYYCLQCQRFVYEEEENHLDLYPDHVLQELFTTSGLYDFTLNDSGFSQEISAPSSGTSTVVVSGFDTIESALNFLVASGVPTGMPTQVISGFPTIEAAIQAIVTSGISAFNPNGTPTTTLSGYETLEGAIEDLREDFTSLSGSVEGCPGQLSIDYAFDGYKSEGIYNRDDEYEVKAHVIFKGTNILGNPSSIKVVAKSQSGYYGYNGGVRIFDLTNNSTVVTKSISYDSSYRIIDLGELSNLSEDESIWEIQIKGHKYRRLYILSLSIYF